MLWREKEIIERMYSDNIVTLGNDEYKVGIFTIKKQHKFEDVLKKEFGSHYDFIVFMGEDLVDSVWIDVCFVALDEEIVISTHYNRDMSTVSIEAGVLYDLGVFWEAPIDEATNCDEIMTFVEYYIKEKSVLRLELLTREVTFYKRKGRGNY